MVRATARAVFVRRGAHSDENHLARLHRRFGIGGELQSPQPMVAHHHGLKPWLVNRDAPGIQAINLVLIHVHADHFMAHLGKTGSGYQADIARAKYGDFHMHLFIDSADHCNQSL